MIGRPTMSELLSRPRVQRPALSFGECEEALLVQQAVEARVALAAVADEASQREGVEVARVAAILVDLAHIQLHSAMLLRGDEPVRRRALPGKVEVNNLALLVLHGCVLR